MLQMPTFHFPAYAICWKDLDLTNKYEIVIFWSDEDKSFIADVPELPGCMADGKTYQEALSNAEIVINEWIEVAKELGREIPREKGRLMFA